ncbi:hypothetical protein J6590_016994 [Homalodisca vitripennis]|nr:hypothetical protein J6590_016994 [Homalodisca vitripennis]
MLTERCTVVDVPWDHATKPYVIDAPANCTPLSKHFQQKDSDVTVPRAVVPATGCSTSHHV